MTIKARKEIQDAMDKRDAYISKLGQEAAKRYLRSKETPPTHGNIRAGIAFTLAIAVVILTLLAL